MTRCYIDANYLYATLREPQGSAAERVRRWRVTVAEELEGGSAVVSALVLDELAYRLILAWLRDDGDGDPLTTYRSSSRSVSRRMATRLDGLWSSLDTLQLELAVTDAAVVATAKRLMADPGFAPRDAFHAAHALAASCEVIVSSDGGYEGLGSVRRLGPPA